MLEHLRNHQPTPTDEETAWMTCDVAQMLARSVALVAIAVTIGMALSHAIDASDAGTLLAQTAAR